jgi:hypothetical protein
LDEIEDIPAAEKVTTYEIEKKQQDYDKASNNIPSDKVVATYKHENITFISVSEEWNYDGLKEICEELLLNKHGDEIKELEYVIVYGDTENSYIDDELLGNDMNYIPVKLFNLLPSDYACGIYNYIGYFKIFNGDYYYKVEYIAPSISSGYGEFFMNYYFGIHGNDSDIESSKYFKLRHQGNQEIIYGSNTSNSIYSESYHWYLSRIAAYDYVYLLGSPTVKTNYDYMDSLEQLRLSHSDETEQLNEYFHHARHTETFNEVPVINASLPMPDQIKGLPELLFSQIGLSAPDYEDRTEKTDEINLKISKHSEYGETFCVATWEKPWDDEDVTYTLVAYKDNDLFFAAVKSIDGTERARAIFGGAVYRYSEYRFTYYETDEFKREGFLRFRVLVTFPDGTAVFSDAVDWSFE